MRKVFGKVDHLLPLGQRTPEELAGDHKSFFSLFHPRYEQQFFISDVAYV